MPLPRTRFWVWSATAILAAAGLYYGSDMEPSSALVASSQQSLTTAPPNSASRPGRTQGAPEASLDIELGRLQRPARSGAAVEIFGAASWQPPLSAKPAAPEAPPLPFQYIGRWVESGRIVVFLGHSGRGFPVVTGDTVQNHYQVDAITDDAVVFIYKPLDTKQVLPIPSR